MELLNKGVHFHFSPGRCSASGSHRASEDLGRLHPSSLSSCSRVITILPPTTSQSQGLDCPNPWGCSGSEPGCSTCAVSQEAEEERVQAMVRTPEFCLLSPLLSLASPSLPHALNGACENALLWLVERISCFWAGFMDLAHEELCSPLGSIGELSSLCV